MHTLAYVTSAGATGNAPPQPDHNVPYVRVRIYELGVCVRPLLQYSSDGEPILGL